MQRSVDSKKDLEAFHLASSFMQQLARSGNFAAQNFEQHLTAIALVLEQQGKSAVGVVTQEQPAQNVPGGHQHVPLLDGHDFLDPGLFTAPADFEDVLNGVNVDASFFDDPNFWESIGA